MFGIDRQMSRIRRVMQVGDPPARALALQQLLVRARKDPGVHDEALRIFINSLQYVTEPLAATSAARGIALIAGADEGRRIWLYLLRHPRVDVAMHAALAIDDPDCVPGMLDALAVRPEFPIQISLIRTLGRLGDPVAMQAIVERLTNGELQTDAIQALEELGDARAIPALEPLLSD